ncbi:MAG: hypothetical protein R6W48_04995 [Gaiellaceae bacterium]
MSTLPHLLATSADDSAIVVAIVAARLLVPLLIPRIPLVIVVALVLDAADQTILAAFTEVDTGEGGPYQSYDKALDIYYLTIAYLSTIRNWTSEPALRVGQFLFFYRLVGTALFELTQERALLLIFPNTFEYYFIAYELIRLRRDPAQFPARVWLLVAAGLWIFVKLPQEYWIHIAQRDFTDTVREYPAFGVAVVLGVLAVLGVLWFVVRPRMPAPDWSWQFRADPIPTPPELTRERLTHRLNRRFLSLELFEEVTLLSLLCVIFSQIIPRVDTTPSQVTVGVVAIVMANTLVSLWSARRGGVGLDRYAVVFAARLALNFGFVFLASALPRGGTSFSIGDGLFFAYLITLVLVLYDLYRPLHIARFRRSAGAND